MESDFSSLSLSPELLAVVGELGYVHPTPIQRESIPVLLAGKDLVGQSKTGSGKTAAFALPILQRLDLSNRSVQALVLCPTRELSTQVAREIRGVGRRHAGLGVVELVGGQSARAQKDALGRGVHVAVGTPGRVLDLLQKGVLAPGVIATVVLDEADRMLDMGFGTEVEAILRTLPQPRQTALFSATFPDTIAEMSQKYQRDAVHVTIDEAAGSALEIRELKLASSPNEKFRALCWLLNENPHESALIFCNFKATVVDLARRFAKAGISADRLDGDLEQFHRDQVLARFRNQSLRLLFATDVAGRGIDVEGLDLVINYEVPQQPEIYVHRIGRTGRAGQKGVAISLTSDERDSRIDAVEALTGRAIESLVMDPEIEAGSDALLRSLAKSSRMETILISGGRKDKIRPGDILGALTGEAGGLQGDAVGKIEIQDRLSYVAVAKGVCANAVAQLNKGRIKGKRFRATHVGGLMDRAREPVES